MDLTTLAVHELAARYPMHNEDELKSLADGIAEVGLIDPILIWTEDKLDPVLVDGRNRLAACEMVGVDPRYEELTDIDDERVRLIILQRNGERRSQSKGQKAMMYAVAFPEGQQGKRSDLTSSDSEEVGTSEGYISMARTILKWNPNEVDGVIAGSVKFDPAYQKALGISKEDANIKKAANEQTRKFEEAREKHPEIVDQVDDGTLEPEVAIQMIEQEEEEAKNVRNSVYVIFEKLDLVVCSLINDREYGVVIEALEHPDCTLNIEPRSLEAIGALHKYLKGSES